MRQKPIPQPEPIEEPQPQPYALRHQGLFLPNVEEFLTIIENAVSPILEKYEFDFVRRCYTSAVADRSLGDYDGGCIIWGSAETPFFDNQIRVLCGEGVLRLKVKESVDVDTVEVLNEIYDVLKILNVSAYGQQIPFAVDSPRFDEIHFKFGHKVMIKADFVPCGRFITPEEKELANVAIGMWENHPINY